MRLPSVLPLHPPSICFSFDTLLDMTYLDHKDQIRLALALYVIKHRGEKNIDEFVNEMRSRFKSRNVGVLPSLNTPSPRPSLTQRQVQPPIPSLLGLWNDKPFPLSDRHILELDIFLQEASYVCLKPDLMCAGSIIGTLTTINQTLYPRPVQDSPSSTSPVQSLKSLTLRLVRTLHVLLRLALMLPSSQFRFDLVGINSGQTISCLYLILQTTLREVLPRLTPDEVTTVYRSIGREIFSEAAKALSGRIAKNTESREQDISDDDLKNVGETGNVRSDDDGDANNKDSMGKEMFSLIKLLYAFIHLDSSLLGSLIRSLLTSLTSLFPPSPDFLSLSSASASGSPPSSHLSSERPSWRWSKNQTFEIGLLRDVLDLLLFAIRSMNDPILLSTASLLPPSHRRRRRRQSRLDHDQDVRMKSRRVGQAVRSVRSHSYDGNASSQVRKQRNDYEGEDREDEVEGIIEEEANSEEDKDEEERGELIWTDLGRFCRRLHYVTTRSSRTIRYKKPGSDSEQEELERVVSKFLEDVWTIEGDRAVDSGWFQPERNK